MAPTISRFTLGMQRIRDSTTTTRRGGEELTSVYGNNKCDAGRKTTAALVPVALVRLVLWVGLFSLVMNSANGLERFDVDQHYEFKRSPTAGPPYYRRFLRSSYSEPAYPIQQQKQQSATGAIPSMADVVVELGADLDRRGGGLAKREPAVSLKSSSGYGNTYGWEQCEFSPLSCLIRKRRR